MKNVKTTPRPFVFVLMPFDESFTDIYKYGIKKAVKDIGGYAERVDDQIFSEGMMERIFNQINKADVLVADMTGRNPNVFYEVGYAHSLGKHVILLTQTAEDIPFDLRHHQHLIYNGKIDILRKNLPTFLEWAIREGNPGRKDEVLVRECVSQIRKLSDGLHELLHPLAERNLARWKGEVQSILTSGLEMSGTERLRITEEMIYKEREYILIELLVAGPKILHSKDWIEFYKRLSLEKEIQKEWFLVVSENELIDNFDAFKVQLDFYRGCNFVTWFSNAQEVMRATSRPAPQFEAAEMFGNIIKTLRVKDGSYAPGPDKPMVSTVFRKFTDDDKTFKAAVEACKEPMTADFFHRNKKSQ